ncbi:hypothetical protein CYMTET_32234 [Cymbomonas tetramitiformis]|uniref:Uncharacterized protein n=1 Tax=Cymbomonas tetramitiformis TaxID=36881 RepID=A0AAE0FFG8_9CHLO|nr:hypothetical protein CYMTET_32234 [Cymbomonas tetramitiformis]
MECRNQDVGIGGLLDHAGRALHVARAAVGGVVPVSGRTSRACRDECFGEDVERYGVRTEMLAVAVAPVFLRPRVQNPELPPLASGLAAKRSFIMRFRP